MAFAMAMAASVSAWGVQAPGSAAPMPADARERYNAGLAAYVAKDYAAAVHELAAAHRISPRPEILFAWAQATRLKGDCAEARALFERFLDTRPPAQQVEATRIALGRCQEARPASTPTPTAVSAPAARVPATPRAGSAATPSGARDEASSRAWYLDRLAPSLAIGGLAVGALGLIVATNAAADARAARAESYEQYDAQIASAKRRQRAGVAAAVLGAGLVVAGAGRYLHLVVEERGVRLALAGRY